MKLFLTASISVFTVTDQRVARDVDKRSTHNPGWELLIDLLRYYDSDFDEEKWLVYGCHCQYNGKFNWVKLQLTEI